MDRARKDAAPRRKASDRQAPAPGSGGGSGSSGPTSGGSGGTGGSGGSTGVGDPTATSIRSENNFGTSSEVPGATTKPKSSRHRGGSGGADGTADDGRGSGGAGEAAKRVAGISSATAASTDGPSDGVVFPLLAALVAVGAGIGIFAGSRTLRGRRGE